MNLLKWLKPKHKPVIELEWRNNFVYILKDKVSIGHVSWFIDDKETKDKVTNLLKLLK